MSGQLRELKNRIKSVENTKKITHAMEMVAAAKLRKFQNMMAQAKPYTEGLHSLLLRLSESLPSESHAFFEAREEKSIAVIVMTSDSGLCGAYNLQLVDKALEFLNEHPAQKTLIGVGKAGINGLKRQGFTFHKEFVEIRPTRFDEILEGLRSTVEGLFLSQAVDAVYVVYSHFVTLSQFKETSEKLLPLTKPVVKEGSEEGEKYIFTPSAKQVFDRLIPIYFEAKNRQFFLESVVSEQIARMTAMHSATENAKEMIDTLVLKRNKARQAAITKEIIEIVSGSQALKLK